MDTRKELKEQYKQMEAPMGVFQIKNTSNGKVFIDHSTDLKSKWNRHTMELKFGSHKSKSLQKDWNEFGEGNFIFEVLSELERKDEENIDYNKELETLQELILEELSKDRLYN
ncbi:MAG: GIY-YIG nuclease family protein [Balneola sp.]